MENKQLSKNFSLHELTYSWTANDRNIDNTPNEVILENLKKLCNDILQPIRNKYGKQIRISSGFRCPELNYAVGGSKTSQHKTGEAADIQAVDGDNAALFQLIKEMIDDEEIVVSQCIWEKGNKKQPAWIHIGHYAGRKKNQILYLY